MTARALLIECLISLNFFCNWATSSGERVRFGSFITRDFRWRKHEAVLD